MASTSAPSAVSDKRLYVGNLSVSVDEYALMQVCAKYGKISKLDYLFHKSGPQRGKPRGYAFVEFATKEEAKRAMTTLHDKVLRGRKLVVSLASEQDPKDQPGGPWIAKHRKAGQSGGPGGGAASSEPNRPTAISLLKGQGVAHVPTNRKIAALEAKLALMKRTKDASTPTPPPPSLPLTGFASGSSNRVGGGGEAGAQAEEWLNTLELPREKTTTTPTTPQATTTTTTAMTRNNGLPARPVFESNEPPREL